MCSLFSDNNDNFLNLNEPHILIWLIDDTKNVWEVVAEGVNEN